MNDHTKPHTIGAGANETVRAGAGNRMNAPYLSHISIKIGIIVATVGSLFFLTGIPFFSWWILYPILICVSWLLWASVWHLVIGPTDYKKAIFFHKPYAMFWIHVIATATPSILFNNIPGTMLRFYQ